MSLLVLVALGLLLVLFLMARSAAQTATEQAEATRDASARSQQGSQKSPRQSAREITNEKTRLIANAEGAGRITAQQAQLLRSKSPTEVAAWLEGQTSAWFAQQSKSPTAAIPLSQPLVTPIAPTAGKNSRARSRPH